MTDHTNTPPLAALTPDQPTRLCCPVIRQNTSFGSISSLESHFFLPIRSSPVQEFQEFGFASPIADMQKSIETLKSSMRILMEKIDEMNILGDQSLAISEGPTQKNSSGGPLV